MTDEVTGIEGKSETSPRPVNWARWFVLIGLAAGTYLILYQPMPMSLDEAHHFARMEQIAHGRLIPTVDGSGVATATLAPCAAALEERLEQSKLERRSALVNLRMPACTSTTKIDIGNTAVNSPVAYVPALLGYFPGALLGGPLVGVVASHFSTLFVYVGLFYLAIRVAPRGKPFLALVGLLPTPMSVAVAVSADPLPLALSALAVALILRLRDRERTAPASTFDRWSLWALPAVVLALGLSKNIYQPMVLLLLLVPTGVFRSPRRHLAYVVGTGTLIVGTCAAWAFGVASRIHIAKGFLDSEVSREWMVENKTETAVIMLRTWFGSTTLSNHTSRGVVAHFYTAASVKAVAPIWLTLTVIALGYLSLRFDGAWTSPRSVEVETPAGLARWWPTVIVALICFGVLVTISFGQFVSSSTFFLNPPRTLKGMEGRIFTPLLPLAVIAWASVRTRAQSGRRTQRHLWSLFPTASAAILLWYAFELRSFYG